MKHLYSLIASEPTFSLYNKGTPLYAGTTGEKRYSSLEQELYRKFSKPYRVLYPMEYWCSGLVAVAEQGYQDPLWPIGQTSYIYDLVVHNPLFFQEETVVRQHLLFKRRKFLIDPAGEVFEATFSIQRKYKTFSHIRARVDVPFQQGVLALASFLGSPVLGDHLYGIAHPLFLSTLKKRKYKPKSEIQESPLIQRPAIHLSCLQVEEKLWEAPFTKDFQSVVNNLRKYDTLAEEQFLETWLESLQS